MGGYSAVMDMPGVEQLGYTPSRKTISYVVLRKKERALLAYVCAAEFRHSLKVACRPSCGPAVLEDHAAILEQRVAQTACGGRGIIPDSTGRPALPNCQLFLLFPSKISQRCSRECLAIEIALGRNLNWGIRK